MPINLQDLDYRTLLYSPWFSTIIVTSIIVIVGLIIGRILRKVIYRVLHELEVGKIVKKATGIKFSIEKVISNFVGYLIYFITLIMALNSLGLSTTVLNILIFAVLVLAVIIVSFFIKDFFPNIVAGIIIQQKGFIQEKDYIQVGDYEGRVTKISLIETTLKTKTGNLIYIPNAVLTKKEVVKRKK